MLAAILTPELVTRAVNEHVFKRGLADRNSLNLTRERLDYIRDEAMTAFALDPYLIPQDSRVYMEAAANLLSERVGVVGRVKENHVTTNFVFQFGRCTKCDEIALIHDGEAITTLGFFHQVRRYEDRDVLFVTENLQILPQITASAGIETRRRLIQQQDAGMVQESFSELNPALHASGERLDAFLGTICETDAREYFFDTASQSGAAEAVQVSLMPQVFISG